MLICLEELYTIVNDFCKEYEKNSQYDVLENQTKKTRNRKTKVTEILLKLLSEN